MFLSREGKEERKYDSVQKTGISKVPPQKRFVLVQELIHALRSQESYF